MTSKRHFHFQTWKNRNCILSSLETGYFYDLVSLVSQFWISPTILLVTFSRSQLWQLKMHFVGMQILKYIEEISTFKLSLKWGLSKQDFECHLHWLTFFYWTLCVYFDPPTLTSGSIVRNRCQMYDQSRVSWVNGCSRKLEAFMFFWCVEPSSFNFHIRSPSW